MELRQLEIFVAVAEERHFGRAAELLFIGQPAVSQQIGRLERELHVQLFNRSSRRVSLTPAGETLLARARDVLSAAQRARSLTDELTSEEDVLSLGTCAGLGDHLRRILGRLSERAPGLRVDLVSANRSDRMEYVANGRLDAAFSHAEAESNELSTTLVWRDKLVICLPARHELAGQPDVAMASLAGLPLRISSRRANPVLYDVVLQGCRGAGFEPLLGPTSVSLEDNLTAISIGSPSWTVMYESHARLLQTRDVVFQTVRGAPLIVDTYLVLPARRPMRWSAELFDACRADAPQPLVAP